MVGFNKEMNMEQIRFKGNEETFRINMKHDDLQKKDVLYFSSTDGYVVTKVYRFKRLRKFLVRLGFSVKFYDIKPIDNAK